VVSTVLVPAAAFYSSVDALIASSPELSITAEAYFLTRQLRESFAQPVAPVLPVAGKRKLLQQVPNLQLHGVQGESLLPPHTRGSVSFSRSPNLTLQAIIIQPTLGGLLPNPVLPDPGMCVPGLPIASGSRETQATLTGILRTTHHEQ